MLASQGGKGAAAGGPGSGGVGGRVGTSSPLVSQGLVDVGDMLAPLGQVPSPAPPMLIHGYDGDMMGCLRMSPTPVNNEFTLCSMMMNRPPMERAFHTAHSSSR